MNNLYLSQAAKFVKNPNILVNMVSQRVRQLGQGHKAMVAVDERMSFMDVALKEIAEGKLEFELDESILMEEQESRRPSKKKK
jgi:DNA-directed RNA polymerase subunit omega